MEKYQKIYDLGKDFGYKYTEEFRPYKNIMWESRLFWGVGVRVLMMIDGCAYTFHMEKDHEYIGEMQSDYFKDDPKYTGVYFIGIEISLGDWMLDSNYHKKKTDNYFGKITEIVLKNRENMRNMEYHEI